jgi:ketosteroid isomerase-like protein
MREEDLAAFQHGVEAYNRRDTDAFLEVVDPEIEMRDVFRVMLGGDATTFRGHEGIREMIREQVQVFAEFDAQYSEIRDLGDRLVALGTIRTRGRESGAEIRSPVAAVVDFRDGKAVRIQTFLDRGQALQAAGLSE